MTTEEIEDVESFRQRARTWIGANLRPIDERSPKRSTHVVLSDEEELAEVKHDRELQRQFFDAGFAGLCFPRSYGGQGLTAAHQRALNEELAGYEFPQRVQVPNLSPCAAVLLEFGTEGQKAQHLPAMLKGEELWMQFLSEPSGGSDVAGALTTAVRDGDVWILNGSKVWTTGAWWSDWGLCLARTNWDVPKHRGLSVFMVPIHHAGVDVHRIEMLNGSKEFCQEFLTDVAVPDTDRIGDVDDGWTVGVRWMFHERMLYNSPFVTHPAGSERTLGSGSLVDVARAAGRLADPYARDLIGDARVMELVREELQGRVRDGILSGRMSDQAAAIVRLFSGVASARAATLAFEIAGATGGVWTNADGDAAGIGTDFLMRQAGCIGGGTTEMARNVISERVLGMPRERTLDRDVAFREVPRSRPAG